jgi:multiple sugar transport system substrate-binding protein
LWAHGGNLVDKGDKVVINSPETVKALEYVKALYENFIPGTASWNDSSNNKIFVSGDLHCTNNGISIYVAAQKDNKPVAEDMNHAAMPIGPVGKPTELHLAFPILTFQFTKAPQACKALSAFMLEAENYNPWVEAAQGYLSHFLLDYDKNPVWTADPKRTAYRDVAKNTLTPGGQGSLGEKAASAIADFIVVDMFANYATGREDAKGAIAVAERQAKRIYR